MNKLFERFDNPVPQKLYKGIRFEDETKRGKCLVLCNDVPLYPVLIDQDDNTMLYEWGYRGFLAKNLTYSILADYLETADFPEQLAFMFHTYFTARLPFDNWEIGVDILDSWIDVISQEYEQ